MKTTRLELKESGVIFNEQEHTYTFNGKELSGITALLQRQLFPNEFDGIPQKILQAAADYGISVHQSCEDFDKNWINDGTVEVQDYIQLCHSHGLIHEQSEYTVTDSINYASNIDKVFRTSDDTFSLADIKTYGSMTPEKLEKVSWQLSIYAYMFELQNKKAKIDNLYVVHLRNKEKSDGTIDHICELIPVKRIPVELCKELLDCDLKGEKFINPYGIPDKYRQQEEHIRHLIEQKAAIDEELSALKARILAEMEIIGAKSWATETMKLTRKLPSQRQSLDLPHLKEDHPEIDYQAYMKTSNVASSLTISI